MKILNRLLSIVVLLAVVACGGGGGNAGTAPFGGGTTPGGGTNSPAVASLDVRLSSPTIPNTGTGTVTATITALDANRAAVSGAAVAVSVSSGLIALTGGTGTLTDSNGRITATISIGSDTSNRPITITATSGNATPGTAVLNVVPSPTGNTPTLIELIAAATSVGTGGDGVVIRAFVKDANNNALPGAAVSFVSTTGTLTAVSTATDAAGVASATFSAGADKTNRSATITVRSGTVSSDLLLPITGTRMTLSGPTSLIRGAVATFDVVVTDSKNNVVPNISVTATSSLNNPVAATGGSGATAATNASGQVSIRYTATNSGTDTLEFAGANTKVSPSPALVISGQNFAFVSPAASTTVAVGTQQTVRVRLDGVVPLAGRQINFAATGGTLSAATATTDNNGEASVGLTSTSAGPVTVQATVNDGSGTSTTLPLLIVATVPSRLVLQVTPTAIAPNIGTSTANQAQIVAKVTDAAGNPVQGQTVNFTRLEDPSGGNLLQATATTDSSGQASVAYRAGSESTANNGVKIRSTVASNLSVFGETTLTVNQTALFIALGTGNDIANIDPQTYRKDWVVYVTDSNGIPVNGVTLTIKAIPTAYLMGKLKFNGLVWDYIAPLYACPNEDQNANGALDLGEDSNGDGVLWPGNVIAVSPGNVQTVNGRATISLTYAESYVPWVQLRLTASATVSGTESKTDAEFIVGGTEDDFSSPTLPPSGVVSPFGAPALPGPNCIQIPLP